MDQEDLAMALGLDKQAVMRLENGVHSPKRERLIAIAVVTGVEFSYFGLPDFRLPSQAGPPPRVQVPEDAAALELPDELGPPPQDDQPTDEQQPPPDRDEEEGQSSTGG